MSPYARIILQSLMQEPKTRMEIIETCTVTRATMFYQISVLHKRGAIYISAWRRYNACVRFQPVFAAGEGKDARCPFKRKTSKQRNRDYINQMKANGEIAHHRSRKAAQKRARTILTGPPKTWFAALQRTA